MTIDAGDARGPAAPSSGTPAASIRGQRPLLVELAIMPGHYALAKRTLDIVLSIFALVILAPVSLAIAGAVVAASGRPIIFRQTRLGLGGRPFTLYKFRSMTATADAVLAERRRQQIDATPDDPIVKAELEDDLITPIGRFLRSTSLDEIPQFVNVLKGDMSLVGPRPPLPEEAATYTPRQAKRLSVLPGLTGLWQVSGRSTVSFDRWIELDLEYLERRSFEFDLRILLLTIPAVLSRRGAR